MDSPGLPCAASSGRVSNGAPCAVSPCVYRPCVCLLAATAVGAVGSRWVAWSGVDWLAAAAVCGLAGLLASGRRCDRVACFALYATLAAVFAAWSDDRRSVFAVDELAWALDETPRPVSLEARVRRGPRFTAAPQADPLAAVPSSDRSQLTIAIERVRDGRVWRPASGLAELTVDGQLVGVRAGDRVRVHGQAFSPGPPRNPGERNAAEFHRARRVLCLVRAPHPEAVERLQEGSSWNPRRWLDEARRRGRIWLQRHVAPEQAGLAAAVLLGVREDLDEERSSAFFEAGLAHLLAVSGLNVAVFAYGFWMFARAGWLPRRPAILAAACLALGYALVTDAEAPVLRAALLVVGSAIGRWSGRSGSGENGLAGAACLVLWVDPSSLFQVGAQLSFLAVAVLERRSRPTLAPAELDPLDRLLARSRPWPVRAARRLYEAGRESFTTGACVWAVTLPLVIRQFQVVSPVALLLNPLVTPPMSAAMYGGAAALATAEVWPAAAECFGRLCGGCLQAIEAVVELGLRLPGACLWTPPPPPGWCAAFYVVAAVWSVRPNWRPPRRWQVAAVAVWLGWLGVAWLPPPSSPLTFLSLTSMAPPFLSPAELGRSVAPDRRRGPAESVGRSSDSSDEQETRVTFVAVGHGTSALIELPDGRAVLYDAGRLGRPAAGARLIAGTILASGRTHLDAVVISHADTDHYNALPTLLERFSVGVVYVSPAMFREPSGALDALRAAVERAGVPLRRLKAGDRLAVAAPASIEVWHPPADASTGSDNSLSIVLAVEHAGRRLLLPGDLESPGLDRLLAGPPRPCDVVMAPHHGSGRSRPSQFARWASPAAAVVSGSKQRDDPTVRRAFESAGCRVLHTAEQGAVLVRLRRDSVRVCGWRDAPDGFGSNARR